MQMGDWSWLVMAYVLALGLTTTYVIQIPMWLVVGRINKHGIAGRPVTRGMGLTLIFLLNVLGFACLFALLLVPIRFSRDMDSLYPLRVWFGIPFTIGVCVTALAQRLMKR